MAAEQVFDGTRKIRAFVPALLSALIVWLCVKAIGPVDLADVGTTFASFSPAKWALACALTAVSFWAVSKYDPLVANSLQLNISKIDAQKMGWRATAVAQLAGFGLFTGTFVRWWCLTSRHQRQDKTGLKEAFTLTCGVTGTFLFGWACTLGIVSLIAGGLGVVSPWIGVGTLGVLAAICLARLFSKKLAFPTPRLGFVAKSINLTALDTIAAAGIIYVFLPDSYDSFLHIYLIFLLSFVIGMISGLPGGVGPFEIAMMYFLPQAAPSELIPAFLAFRLVYYVLPAAIALAILAKGSKGILDPVSKAQNRHAFPAFLSSVSSLGADLIHQNQLQLVHCEVSESSSLITSKNAVDIVFRSPLSDRFGMDRSISSLMSRSASKGNKLCIYQCDPATALIARHAGMKAFKFSAEAIVKTRNFDISAPQYAKLRRKTRKADKALVTVNSNHFDFADLSAINRSWIADHGSEHGLSTGRFTKSLISRQRIYVAFQSSRPIAFVTFSTSNSEWTLDLIRHHSQCPDGTIYALIAQAIHDAKMQRIENLSLGCVPLCPPLHDQSITGRVSKFLFQRNAKLKGLYQFKQVFSPNWHDRFVAFSSVWHIPASILVVFQAIHYPPQMEENS